ncbi:MAG TPA: anti-sigma E factor, partial [Vibrio sp.]|nr:anti-sigma E factor [Vibrio sp.]
MADKEKLSALMDGELVDKALIVDLEQDQEGLDTWKNYHLIGDVLRGDSPAKPEWNIAESVALALENEPAHTPFNLGNITDINDARIESQPTPQAAKRYLPTWLTQFGQVGIAACVSLAVI